MKKPRPNPPIVLTHKPRHRTASSDWELEFSVVTEDTEPAVEKLAILGTALRRMEQNLRDLEQKAWIRLRLEGLEEFLREFNRLAVICLAFDKTGAVSRLAVRAIHDFIIGVYGALSGQHVVMFESMRDVMEIELLLREFRNQPQRIQEWINSDNPSLKRNFAPDKLRELHAKRIGVRKEDLPESTDYKAHSIGLHVTPFREVPPFGSRDMIVDSSDPFAVDACFWEMFMHARSLFGELWGLLDGKPEDIDKNARLRKFVDANASVERSSELYYGILNAITRQLAKERPADNELVVDSDHVPKDYQGLFRDLCDGGILTAHVFPRR
jgi:hypothetical protein